MDQPNFVGFLTELENGHFLRRLNDALPEVVSALHDYTGKKTPTGSITIKINLAKDDDVIEVTPEITLKVPKTPVNRTIFWSTPQNNLTRIDPRQSELPLKTVSVPSAAPRGLA